jgi:Ataxin-2 C-terminal region
MESDQDINSTFSTLNVNAIEFIPSFASTTASSVSDSDTGGEESVKPVTETIENNGNGESYAKQISGCFVRRKKIFATSNVDREKLNPK